MASKPKYTPAEALAKLREDHGARGGSLCDCRSPPSEGFEQRKDITTIEGEVMDLLLCLPKLKNLSFVECT